MSHASKIILRIVVTLLILALVGVSVWLLFFRPSDSLSVFGSLTSLETTEKNEFNQKLNSYYIKKDGKQTPVKGIKDSYEVKPTTEGETSIYLDALNRFTLEVEGHSTEANRYRYMAYYRAFMFSNHGGYQSIISRKKDSNSTFTDDVNPYINVAQVLSPEITASELNFVNFENIYNAINKVYNYYYSYSQLASGVDKAATDNINSKISSFKSAINSFNSKADEILKLQTQIPTTYDPTVVNELYKSYANLYERFFEILKTYNNLTVELRNFVNKYVFDSKPVYDSVTVQYELTIRTISEFTNKTLVDPIKFIDHDSTGLTEEEEAAYQTEFKTYQNFLSHAYDAMIMNKLTSDKVTDQVVQDYADLLSYSGDNAATANAITGSQNIFTLTREVKSQLIKDAADRLEGERAPSDLYYTETYNESDQPFGVKIVNLITAIYRNVPKNHN